jgi:chromosome partitioning protein
VATEDAVQETYLSNLRILSAARNLTGVESAMATDRNVDRVALALAAVRDEFDLILLDCSPGMGWLFRMAMRAAQAYVIPMRLEPFSFEGLSNCMANMTIERPEYGLKAQMLGITLLGVDFRLQRHCELIGDVRATYGGAVFSAFVRQNEPVAEAPGHGKAVVDFKPQSRGALGFREVTREMLTRASRRSLFDRQLLLTGGAVAGETAGVLPREETP